MKTLVLASVSTAALLVAGVAFAAPGTQVSYTPAVTQTSGNVSSSIDQVGDANTATVNQRDASSEAVRSVIIQGLDDPRAGRAHDNTATVTQTGDGQRSLVVQGNVGNANFSNFLTNSGAAGNTATVDQSGNRNNAFTYQFGYNNASTVTQTGNNGGANNTGTLYGVNNRSNTLQAETRAFGARTTSLSTIDTDLGNTTGTTAPIANYPASGSQNQAVVVQDWSINNLSTVTQNTADNQATVVQAFQTNSTAKITQDPSYSTGRNKAWIVQASTGSTPGTNDYAEINQNGLQFAAIEQINASTSYSRITQKDGSVNEHAVNYQTGANNYSTIDQFGSSVNDRATVYQSGGNDVSYVSQTGAGSNTATVLQGLASAWSNVNQNGLSNTANVNQYATAIVRTNPTTSR